MRYLQELYSLSPLVIHQLIDSSVQKIAKLSRFQFKVRSYIKKSSLTFSKNESSYLFSRRWFSSSTSAGVSQLKLITRKIDSPEFHSLFTPELKCLQELFSSKGHELRITGGAIRDILVSLKPNNLDFATTATPDEMRMLLKEKGIRILHSGGESHGTITVRINERQDFEITTLRIDVKTDGRRAEVKFTTDWSLDVRRRDFTFNSMYLGLDGTLYDYFNGYEDLQRRQIVFIGDPVQRMKEDYLRILRYFRFYGRIADHPSAHDPKVLEAIHENSSGLSNLTGSKIWNEVQKILLGPYKFDILESMLRLGISSHIGLPKDPNIQNYQEFRERAETLNPQPVTILSSFIKNYAEMTDLSTRLNYPGYERDLGLFLITHRDDKPSIDPLFPYQALILEANNHRKQVFEYVDEVLKYRGDAKLLEQLQNWKMPRFPVSQDEFLIRGIKGGIRYYRILTALKKKWIDSHLTLSESELIQLFPDVIEEDSEQYPPPKKYMKRKRKKEIMSE